MLQASVSGWPAPGPDLGEKTHLLGALTIWGLTGFTKALPDPKLTLEDVIAEGDKLVSRLTLNGTHRCEIMGIAPTNKRVTVGEIS